LYKQLLPEVADRPDAGSTDGKQGSRGELCFPKAMSDAQKHELAVHLRQLSRQQAQDVIDEIAGRMALTEVSNPIGYGAALVRRAKLGKFQLQLGLRVAQGRAAEQQLEARIRDARTGASLSVSESIARLPKNLRAPMEAIRARSLSRLQTGESDDGPPD
jgi:hypothetical protein